MKRGVEEAASGSAEIANNISLVATAASSTKTGVDTSQATIAELSRMSAELQDLVSQFRC
jgi:methyl-accepting chemotaxis protein